MIAKIIKLQKKSSRYGGYFYYAFFRDEKGDSYYTCLYERMRNYKTWKKYMKVGTTLKGLRIKQDKLIDADSNISEVN